MEAALIEELGSDLYAACKIGDLEKTVALSAFKLEDDQDPTLYLSAMMAVASSKDHRNIVEYCISKGGIVSSTVMTYIMLNRAINTYTYLLTSGSVDPDYYIPWHGDILGVAAQLGDLEWTKLCLDHGANPNFSRVDERKTILSATAEAGHIETVKLLLEHGARLEGSGAIVLAAEAGKVDVVKFLLERGADVDEIGIEDETDEESAAHKGTALHKAVAGGHEDVVRLLLEKGASTDLKDGQERTALELAEEENQNDIAQLLT
ncbi:MAG: hypothetical protein Q9217_005119 [Psora testacea]